MAMLNNQMVYNVDVDIDIEYTRRLYSLRRLPAII